MPIVTPEQLEGAAQDCSSLEDVVNGAANLNGTGTTTTRLGMVLKTIARVFQEITTTGSGWLASAEAAATAAEGYMNQAAQYASSGLYQNLIELDYSDSPYVPTDLQEGSLFMFDTSGGNIVVNLEALSVYGEDMKFAFVKTTNDANTITINRGGSDAINAGTDYVITTEFVITALVGSHVVSQWITAVQATGVPDGSVTNAKLANMVQATIKGRNAGAGTGSPSDLTVAQVTAMLDAVVGDSGSGGSKGLVPAPSAGDAAAGKVLAADGTWKAVAGFAGIKRTFITSTSTFTPDPAAKATFVHGVGGGGNGGGTNSQTGSGGGSGYYNYTWINTPIVGTVTVTINGVGGTSVFGAYLTCNGGSSGESGEYAKAGKGMYKGGVNGYSTRNSSNTAGITIVPEDGHGSGGSGGASGSGGGGGVPGWGVGGNGGANGVTGNDGTGYGSGGGGGGGGASSGVTPRGGSGTGGAFEVIEFLG